MLLCNTDVAVSAAQKNRWLALRLKIWLTHKKHTRKDDEMWQGSARKEGLYSLSKREEDFNEIYQKVDAVLTAYMQDKNKTWYDVCVKFQHLLRQTIKKPSLSDCSLIELIEAIQNFSESLRSNTNWVLTTFFAETSVSVVSGSSLKASIDKVISGKDPFSFHYIHDEIQRQKLYKSVYGSPSASDLYDSEQSSLMRSIHLTELDYLSEDSMKVLRKAESDPQLYHALSQQSSLYRLHDIKYLLGELKKTGQTEKPETYRY